MKLKLIMWWATIGLILASAILARIIIPGLINLHNDGALIFVILLIVAMPTAWYAYWTYVLRPYLKGELN